MTTSAIASESTIEKDVLMAFPPENEASSIRVAPLPQSDSLLEFPGEESRTPIGPVRTDRRRHKSASWASGRWRALSSEVAGAGRWFKDLQRLRSRAVGHRVRRPSMTSSAIISESSAVTEALMAFVPEDQTSNIRVGPLPLIDPLLEFSSEEDRTLVDADPRHESASRAYGAWRVFTSEVARNMTGCVTWLSTRQAALKVGLYEMVVGLSGMAGSFAEAGRARSDSIGRHLQLALCSARATVNALVMRGSAFTSKVAREGRRCLMWLSTCQADLRVGLGEIQNSLHEMAGVLAAAVRVRSHSTHRRLQLALCSARVTLNAIVMRGSLFTSRHTSHIRRALIPFVYGVAAGVVVTLCLPAQSIPGAMRSVVPSVRPQARARSVGGEVQQTATTAGGRESDQTSAVSSARPPVASLRNSRSGQRAAPPKLAKYRGSLAVNSAPKGARVLVNGVPVGTTPLLLRDVPVGSRVVRLELDGYQRWSSAVRVVANERVLTSVDLQPSPSNN